MLIAAYAFSLDPIASDKRALHQFSILSKFIRGKATERHIQNMGLRHSRVSEGARLCARKVKGPFGKPYSYVLACATSDKFLELGQFSNIKELYVFRRSRWSISRLFR